MSSVKVWKSKEKDSYEWTALRGNDKLTLLHRLPAKIMEGDDGVKVTKL